MAGEAAGGVRGRRGEVQAWPTLAPGTADGWFAFLILASRIPLTITGSAGAGLMMLAAVAMAALRPRQFFATVREAWPAWLFPVLALFSTLWAVYPDVTMRAAIQVMLTALPGMMIGKSPRPVTTLIGLFVAFVGYTLLSLVANVQADVGAFEGVGRQGVALVGIGGEAKNFFSDAAVTGMLLSIALFWHGLGRYRLPVLIVLLACAGACILAVVRSHSAGALVAGAAGVAVLLAALLTRGLPPAMKLVMLVAVAVLLLLGFAFYDQVIGIIAGGLSKNPGMTGRDYLWFHAEEQIRARPQLGLGYYGYWHEGNPDALGLGRYFKLEATNSAFSFHNSYIQTTVEMGYVGLGVLLLGWIAGGVGLLWRFVNSASVPLCFWMAYFVTEMSKSGVELIRPATLVAPSIMLFAALSFGLTPGTPEDASTWRRRRGTATDRPTPSLRRRAP